MHHSVVREKSNGKSEVNCLPFSNKKVHEDMRAIQENLAKRVN